MGCDCSAGGMAAVSLAMGAATGAGSVGSATVVDEVAGVSMAVVLGMVDEVSPCTGACELAFASRDSPALSVWSVVSVRVPIAQPATPRMTVAVTAATPADTGLNLLLMVTLQSGVGRRDAAPFAGNRRSRTRPST